MAATVTKTAPRFQLQPNQQQHAATFSPLDSKSKVPRPRSTWKAAYDDGYSVHHYFLNNVIGLDPDIARIFTDLRRLSYQISDRNSGISEPDMTLYYQGVIDAEDHINLVKIGQKFSKRTTKCVFSARSSCALAGYIYLYLFLRRIPLDNSVYGWIVGMLQEDLIKTIHVVGEHFPSEMRFWLVWVGLCAAHGRDSQDWFEEEVTFSKYTLGLVSWENARRVLEKFAWIPSHDDMSKNLWDNLPDPTIHFGLGN